MNQEEMQKRLQMLFAEKQRCEQQANQFSQQALIIQGNINELSYIMQQTPKADPELVKEDDANAIEEGQE